MFVYHLLIDRVQIDSTHVCFLTVSAVKDLNYLCVCISSATEDLVIDGLPIVSTHVCSQPVSSVKDFNPCVKDLNFLCVYIICH